jgi:hypothetical protein
MDHAVIFENFIFLILDIAQTHDWEASIQLRRLCARLRRTLCCDEVDQRAQGRGN